MISLNTNMPVSLKLTPEEFIDTLEKHLNLARYGLRDGIVYEYERVGWNDYDFVPVKDQDSLVCRRVREQFAAIEVLKKYL